MFNTKLVEGLRVPAVKSKVGPLSVNVVQLRVPKLSKLPLFQVNVLEHVKMPVPPRSKVPRVSVAVVHTAKSTTVVYVLAELIVNAPIVVFVRIKPVPHIVTVKFKRVDVLN